MKKVYQSEKSYDCRFGKLFLCYNSDITTQSFKWIKYRRMVMNTSKKWFAIGSVMLLTIGGITMLNLNGNNSSVLQRTKTKQLAYLKEHEQEIIAWMKSKYPRVESVQFDWDTLRVGPVSNGIITTHYNLSVKGTFNNIPETVIY